MRGKGSRVLAFSRLRSRQVFYRLPDTLSVLQPGQDIRPAGRDREYFGTPAQGHGYSDYAPGWIKYIRRNMYGLQNRVKFQWEIQKGMLDIENDKNHHFSMPEACKKGGNSWNVRK